MSKSDKQVESKLNENIQPKKVDCSLINLDGQNLEFTSAEIGYFFLEGRIVTKNSCSHIIIPDIIFNPGVKPHDDQHTIYILRAGTGITAYWFEDDKFVSHLVSQKNQIKLQKLLDGKKMIYNSSKSFEKLASLCGYKPKSVQHLLCIIQTLGAILSESFFKKLLNIINTAQCHNYIKDIQFHLQNNTIEIEFLPLNFIEFYENLIKLIDNLLKHNFRELTKTSIHFQTLVPENKKYNKWINKCIEDQKRCFNQVISTNQKTSVKKRYSSLVEIDTHALEYQTFAQNNKLNHIRSNSSLSEFSLQSLQESKKKVVLKFDLHNLPQQEDKKPYFKDPSKNLVILALGALDSIESFFKLLVRLRLLEMNILISVLKNTAKVIEVKQKTLQNKNITIIQNSVGALAYVKNAGAYAIAYNAAYLKNLLTLLCFKPSLIKETDSLLIYYAISDKNTQIVPQSRFLAVKSRPKNLKENNNKQIKGSC